MTCIRTQLKVGSTILDTVQKIHLNHICGDQTIKERLLNKPGLHKHGQNVLDFFRNIEYSEVI